MASLESPIVRSTARQEAKASRFRYVVVGLLFLIATINYVDRGALSYASEAIISEYGFNKADWGGILGYFGYGYMFGAMLGGYLADRLGPRKVWLIAGVTWSLLEGATAWAGNIGLAAFGGSALAGFAVFRILFGLAEGPAFSIINKTVSRWAAPKERALLSSIALASTPVGSMITAPITVGLLLWFGDWRITFVLIAAISLILVGLFALIVRDRPEESSRVNELELAEIRAGVSGSVERPGTEQPQPSWFSFFGSRTLLFNSVGYFAFLYVTFLLVFWSPKYLQNQFHYQLSSLWYVAMIPWVGSCIAVLVGGRLSDTILRRTGNLRAARGYFAAGSLFVAACCFLAVPLASSAWQAIVLITLANALNTLPNATYWMVVIDTAPMSRVGAFSGITHFIANLSSVVAPTLSGYLIERHGYDSMFVAVGIVSLIGMTAMLLVQPGVLRSGPNRRHELPATN
ncbi:ACS family hexuronate transporter-like MFS transporter [Bradyrhizobium sp. USDA 4461]